MSGATFRVPGYKAHRLLGRGGSGEVWQGTVAASGDAVALKLIRWHAADARAQRRAEAEAARTEAAVLSTLDHPHLVRVHDAITCADGLVLVLDLASGGSLQELLDARGRLAAGEVVTALCPVAAALSYAHAAGVVHGDVAPGNILFTDRGVPLLADLGVARLRGSSAPVRATPAYLDPAVAAGTVPGAASDVFMLAAVAFRALTGTGIWPAGSVDQVVAAAADYRITDVAAALRAALVPDEVAAVLCRSLARDPAQRGSAAEFALDLRHACEPVPVELAAGRARPSSSMPGAAAGLPGSAHAGGRHAARRPSQRRRGMPLDAPASGGGAGGGGVATGGGGAAAVFTRAVRPRPRPAGIPAAGRQRRARAWRPWALAAGALVLVMTGTGVAWSTMGGVSAPGDTKPSAAGSVTPGGVAPVSVVPSSSTGPGSTGSATPPSSAVRGATPFLLTAATAALQLRQLDALRQQAFARRAPVLLTGVYLPGDLLSQDTMTLQRLVPQGCGMDNVRTTYAAVSLVSRNDRSAIVVARASLSPSVLVCGGVAKGQAAGWGPVTLRITLQWRGSGYVIAAVQRAS